MAEDIQVFECSNFGLATVMLRKGADPAAIGAVLQVEMPNSPICVSSQQLTVIGNGPGNWLVFARTASPTWAKDLATWLSAASVSDQSGGYVILRISGPSAREILQKGAFVDLDPVAFGAGSVATTVIAHIGVVIWQTDETPTFHVAMFRSFAESFRDWLRSVSPQKTSDREPQ